LKRSLSALLLSLCLLVACKDPAPGQMEPITRPPDYQEPPKADAPKPAAEPAPDPNKVTLRWKLAAGAPIAYRVEGTGEGGGLKLVYILQRSEGGDLVLRVVPENNTAGADQGTLSERGFILDGLGVMDRNLATVLLELPKNPVATGETWTLGADFVDKTPLGPDFREDTKEKKQRNTVKLTALTGEGDDRVATIEYDIQESLSGTFPPGSRLPFPMPKTEAPKTPEKGKGKGKAKEPEVEEVEDEPSGPLGSVSAEVTLQGKGEFLVKAGRWRSWQGTLVSKTQGYTPPSADKAVAQLPPGSFKLQLTQLESVPAEMQPAAKK
jgi:hypothetical protein